MEEKRNITTSLQEAREWYKSNNKALREKEEAIEYINKAKKNCEGMKPNGAIYEEYIS